MVAAIAAAVSLVRCADERKESAALDVRARLTSYRSLSAPELLPRFDEDRLPRIVVEEEGSRRDWRIAFERDESRTVMESSVERMGELTVIQAVQPPALEPGVGLLVLESAESSNSWAARARWRAEWKSSPAQIPALRRAADTTDDLRVSILQQAVELGGDAALWASYELVRATAGESALTAAEAALASAAVAEDAGVTSEVSRRRQVAAYYFLSSGDFSSSGEQLRLARSAEASLPAGEGAVFLRFHEANLAFATARYGDAERLWREALMGSRALAMKATSCSIREHLALVSQRYGRHAEALASMVGAEACLLETDGSADTARMARLHTNLGWCRLQAAAALERPELLAGAIEALSAAASSYRDMHNSPKEANARANLALAFLLNDDVVAATRELGRARALTADSDPFLAGFYDWVEARVSIATGAFDDALVLLSAAIRRHERVHDGQATELSWRFRLARARALIGTGRLSDALVDLEAGLVEMESVGMKTALRPGRGTFFEDRQEVDRLLVRTYVQLGRIEDAFVAADRGRARLLRSARLLARVDDLEGAELSHWTALLTEVEQARRAREELVQAVVPRSARATRREKVSRARTRESMAYDNAMAFLEQARPWRSLERAGVREIRRELRPRERVLSYVEVGEEVGAFLLARDRLQLFEGLESVATALEGADHVYLIPGSVDQPLLPLIHAGDGDPWSVRSFSFLPYAGFLVGSRDQSTDGARLVVADPKSDLPGARSEGTRVAARWAETTVLIGPSAVGEAVRDALANAGMVHFAGHGVLSSDDPWESYLALAADDRLTVSDVLLQEVPASLVVLNGCETGAGGDLFRDDVLTLAEAFLAAGTRTIVATTRAVEDDSARRFIERFYDHGGAEHPADAFRSAMLASSAEGERAAESFVLVGRRGEPRSGQKAEAR